MGKSLLAVRQVKMFSQFDGLDALHVAIEQRLEELALYFEGSKLPQEEWSAGVLLQQAIVKVKALPAESNIDLMLQEDSYLFFLEQIVSEMEKLYLTIIEINKK